MTMINQRAATINKNVLTQVDALLAFRTSHRRIARRSENGSNFRPRTAISKGS